MDLPAFGRAFFDPARPFTRIGGGSLGGKAAGLLRSQALVDSRRELAPSLPVSIPRFTAIGSDVFDAFLKGNRLADLALSGEPDDTIARAFQRGDLPPDVVGDLRGLVEQVRQPLAVRSSSALEDALEHPFAGVYGTKMIPNDQPDADTRFRKLVEAIKFVYASTFSSAAKQYLRAAGRSVADERMSVLVQEVVGRRHGPRFYPDLSGVARSYAFYRLARATPEEGVVDLALGLGKTIVDGGVAWSYSPARPRVGPPFGSIDDLIAQTQARFWAVNMGRPAAYDPIRETEYLVEGTLADAEADGSLRYTASTYDRASDRLRPGDWGSGMRVLNFAPLLTLDEYPLNATIRRLLGACQDALGSPVEIEFAATFDPESAGSGRFGLLQVRPMAAAAEIVDVAADDLTAEATIVASERALGNGRRADVRHVLYVEPGGFDVRHTPRIAEDLARLNRRLADRREPYVLVGFGRWGSSERWLGIPVEWPQVSGAAALVEATLPGLHVEISQGAHFFQNLSSFHVMYFPVRHDGPYAIDWAWLGAQPVVDQTPLVRLIATADPLTIAVDGRSGRGIIQRTTHG